MKLPGLKGIASFDNRKKNKDKFGDYSTFYLATIVNHMAVLFVPAVENSSMPQDIQPAQDIYFLIDDKGIEALKVGAEIPVGSFDTELNVITNDFRNGFVNLMSNEVQDATDQTAQLTGCKVDLEGAYQLFFFKDLGSGLTSFRAAFPGDADHDKTLLLYQSMVKKVDGLALDCGPLRKNEEAVDGLDHSQTYRVNDTDGRSNKSYANMVIDVTIEQAETFDDEGDLVTEWEVVLYIYEN